MSSSTAFDARPAGSEINADLRDVADRIHQEFADQLDPAKVDECLARVAATFDGAKVRSFVPLLVRRYVSDELHKLLARADN